MSHPHAGTKTQVVVGSRRVHALLLLRLTRTHIPHPNTRVLRVPHYLIHTNTHMPHPHAGTKTQVVVGSRRVHALLLQLQRRQLWRQVASGLERDAAALGLSPGQGGGGPGGGHPVHVSLARLVGGGANCKLNQGITVTRAAAWLG